MTDSEIMQENGKRLMGRIHSNRNSKAEYLAGLMAGQKERIKNGGRLTDKEKREGQQAYLTLQGIK